MNAHSYLWNCPNATSPHCKASSMASCQQCEAIFSWMNLSSQAPLTTLANEQDTWNPSTMQNLRSWLRTLTTEQEKLPTASCVTPLPEAPVSYVAMGNKPWALVEHLEFRVWILEPRYESNITDTVLRCYFVNNHSHKRLHDVKTLRGYLEQPRWTISTLKQCGGLEETLALTVTSNNMTISSDLIGTARKQSAMNKTAILTTAKMF